MRRFALAIAAALSLSACGNPGGGAAIRAVAGPDPTAASAPRALVGALHPDAPMATSGRVGDMFGELTPDGFTFYGAPGKIETIRLPAAGRAIWSASGEMTTAQFARLDTEDGTLPDGTPVRIMHFVLKAPGNGSVEVVRRISTNLADPIAETRIINFVVR